MAKSSSINQEALDRAKEQLDRALFEIMDMGVIESPLLEARPVWIRPFEFVIGQVRDQGQDTVRFWIIGGNLPTDYVHHRVAETARDAARHFAMKWQLDAARLGDPASREQAGRDPEYDWDTHSRALIKHAEHLYSITEDDSLWQ